jgi:hypothetical protein
MGRNNRVRRRQKQRRKRSNKNKPARSSQKVLISGDNLIALCHPVTISLAKGEPPPPSIMADWSTYAIPASARPLRSLLIGFINFVFHGDTAKGDLDRLLPHRYGMKQADLAWLYPLLYAYCLISEQAFVEGDIDSLAKAVNDGAIPCDVKMSGNEPIRVLCAPFYLLFWVMGRPVDQRVSPGVWLRDWLGGSPLRGLLPQLQKFLALKRPRPEQKTVKNLEAALTNIELGAHDEWLDGLHRLLRVFLQQRLSAAQRQSEGWHQCPQVSRLGGLIDTPLVPSWSQLTFSDANTVTLNRLNRLVDTASIPYTERLSLEALKCRILSRYVIASELGEEDFERQLEHVIHLLTARVPAQYGDFAEHCMEITCEWLAQEVGYGRLPPLAPARMRRLSRQRPADYRVALLTFLASGGRKSTAGNTHELNFQHIHFPLFFRALDDGFGGKTVLEHFFWPLTGEAKKLLFTQCCQKVFLGMDEYDAEDFWERWREPLFDVTQAPFNTIVKGQACEADMLFYTALAAVDTHYGATWLQADQLASLIRSAEQLLSTHASDFNQDRVIALLTALSTHQHAVSLFQSWPQVISLIRRITFPGEIEAFLRLALETSHHHAHCGAAEKNELYAICRTLPALRRHLHGRNKSLSRSEKKSKEPAQLSLPLTDLELFGDPS